MIIAMDVAYRDKGGAVAAGVLFKDWADEASFLNVAVEIDEVADYVPGQFYLRELPCLAKLLDGVSQDIDCVVIDGYVTLGANGHPGLGMHLWEHLGRRIPVVGVAKTAFHGTPAEAALCRGESEKPLYVTAVGMPLDEAKRHVASMAGKYRLPELLKVVDRLCRDLGSAESS